MSPTATPTEVLPIDRLEEKVRQLVNMIDALRAERTKAAEEVAKLQRDIEASRAKLAEANVLSAEIGTLREERDLIRDRVSQMISQIDKLNL
jgi:seryl-tRNA synthetase